MPVRSYLRPTAFVDAPFGYDGRVARLAGGLAWFSAVEVQTWEDGKRAPSRLVPVEAIEQELAALPPEARAAWDRLTTPRAALTLGERVIRLDQPQVAGIVNVTPDSFSDGGRLEDPELAVQAGSAMAEAGGPDRRRRGIDPPGRLPVWKGRLARPCRRQRLVAPGRRSRPTPARPRHEAALAAARLVNDVGVTWDPRAAEVVVAPVARSC